MTRRHWYVLCLWFPLILLVVISLGEGILRRFWWHEMTYTSSYILLSGVIGGIQYLLFAAALTLGFAGKPRDVIYRMSWVLPLMFFPVCFVGLWMFQQHAEMHALAQAYITDRTQQDILGFCIRLSMYAVGVGYVYVAGSHGLIWLLSRFGLVKE